MATRRIAGLSIEIEGNTTKLNAALSGTNAEIKNTQTALRDVERLLKLDPTNTELLQQKQRLLGSAVGETKSKLDQLKEAEKQVQQQFENGDVSKAQYDGLRREIIETEQELKKLEGQARDTGNSMSISLKNVGDTLIGVGDEISNVGEKLLPLTAGIGVLGGASFKSAAELEDAIGATEQVYGSASGSVKKWADDLESYYGIAEGEALEYANMMGSMLQNIGGLTEDEAAKQSQALIALAGDLSAMYGGTTADAVQALTGALKGNNTMLDNYGMAVNDALLRAKAYEMGLVDEGAELDLVSKQAATLALVMEQSGDAQGQAAREADGASGSIRAMQATVKDLGTSFGEVLMPMIMPVIQKVEEFVDWLSNLDDGTKSMIVTIALIVAALGPALMIIGKVVSAVGMVSRALTLLAANPIVLVVAAIAGLIALVVTFRDEILGALSSVNDFLQNIFAANFSEQFGFLGSILDGFVQAIKGVWDIVYSIFSGIIDFIGSIFRGEWGRAWDAIVGIFKGIWDGLVTIFKAPINVAIDALNGLWGAIYSAVSWVVNGIGDLVGGLGWLLGQGDSWNFKMPPAPMIPKLANGGTLNYGSAIVGEAGPELLSIVNGRTQVTPLSGNQANSAIHAAGLSAPGGYSVVIEQFNNYDTDVDSPVLIRRISEGLQKQMLRTARANG